MAICINNQLIKSLKEISDAKLSSLLLMESELLTLLSLVARTSPSNVDASFNETVIDKVYYAHGSIITYDN